MTEQELTGHALLRIIAASTAITSSDRSPEVRAAAIEPLMEGTPAEQAATVAAAVGLYTALLETCTPESQAEWNRGLWTAAHQLIDGEAA